MTDRGRARSCWPEVAEGALVEVALVAVEVPAEEALVDALDVDVEAEVVAVDREPDEAAARRRNPGGSEQVVRDALVEERVVLDRVVQRQPAQRIPTSSTDSPSMITLPGK